MMDAYSNYPGPSREEAEKQIISRKGHELFELNKDFIEHGKRSDIEKIINLSVSEAVEEIYKGKDECPYSFTGWSVFGFNDCFKIVKEKLNEKCKIWKAEYLRKAQIQPVLSQMLSQKGIHVKGIEEIINSYPGGYKRSRNKRK